MNSIDQINFKCNYTKKNGFKNLQRKHCHSFSFPFWNSRKTLEQVEGNKNQK